MSTIVSIAEITVLLNSMQDEKPGFFVLDIRTELEFQDMAVDTECAHIPLHLLEPRLHVDVLEFRRRGSPVFILCRAGKRALLAAEILEDAGLADLAVIDGGTLAWEDAGLPHLAARTRIPGQELMKAAAESIQLFGQKWQAPRRMAG